MKNWKSSSESRDRLSELPDSLIFEIFWFLPMIYVVRTTILSKRFKDLWTTAPFLNFVDQTTKIHSKNEVSVRDFFNRALMLWRGSRILKFNIDLGCQLQESFVKDIDVWVRLAKEAEELHFKLYSSNTASQCLYSCSSLKVLSLVCCRLQINGNVEWNQLKSLTFVDVEGIDENAINRVLCGSPKLEVFNLTLTARNENLCINSNSLKKLSIEKEYDCFEYDPSTELRISTPNLETLKFSGVPYSKCLLMNLSSLTDASLQFCGSIIRHDHDCLLERTLGQILPSIRCVENVTLSDWCIKVLGAMQKKHLLSPLSNVKFLKLRGNISKKITAVLEIFPNLKRLVLEDHNCYRNGGEETQFEANLPNSFLLQLRTVEVTWAMGNNSMIPMIQILLKYASNLEKMVFRINGIIPRDYLFLSQKLLRMPRSSPTAELIICENRS